MSENQGVERIYFEGALLALIIRREFSHDGISFFTDGASSQQLGYMRRESGYVVVPHRHNEIERIVHKTQEVLFIRSGECRLDLFGTEDRVVASTILHAGDTVLLDEGGHGLEMLVETEIIEVKQGPYSSSADKTRFHPQDSGSR